MSSQNIKENLQLLEVETYRNYLESLRLKTEIIEQQTEMDFNILIVLSEHETSINIMHIPISRDQFSSLKMLQFHCLIGNGKKQINEFKQILNEINKVSPLGVFRIMSLGDIEFRYVLSADVSGIMNKTSFIELFSIYDSTLQVFKKIILDFISNKINLDQAISEIRELA